MQHPRRHSLLLLATLLVFHSCQFARDGAGLRAEGPVSIWVIGDSTAAAYPADRKPLTGWAEVFQEHFDKSRVRVRDMARSGRSAKSFWDEGAWESVRSQVRRGDYVFIQFGHNDSKREDPARFTDPDTTYKAYLERYVRDARALRAHPVLLTSINRNSWQGQTFVNSMGEYPRAVRELAATLRVPLIDLHEATGHKFEELGPQESQKFFLHLAPGESPNYPGDKTDNTHLNESGARAIAKLAAGRVGDTCPELKPALRK